MHTVTKGPRDKSWTASVTVDETKLSADIMTKLALHGLHQKIADSAAGAKTEAEAIAAMNKTVDSLMKGEWATRTASEGVDEQTRVTRSIMRRSAKAKFGSKSPQWATFTGLDEAAQNAKLDEWFAANAEALQPAVDAEIKRRAAEAKERAKLGSAVAIDL